MRVVVVVGKMTFLVQLLVPVVLVVVVQALELMLLPVQQVL
jgi:hypothetical protein